MKKHKKNNETRRILEITTNNLNSVLLELKGSKNLLDINIRTICIFLFKNYSTPEEIFSKIKIIAPKCSFQQEIVTEEDIVDLVTINIIKLLNSNTNINNLFMLEYITSLDYFSRMFTIWYFDNKSLSFDQNSRYIDKLINIIFKICKLDNKNTDSNIRTNENTQHTLTDSNIQNNAFELIDLDDSLEIERIDNELGKIFKNNYSLEKQDKQKIAKICDVIDQIIENNNVCDPIFYDQIIKLIDIDSVLYKKIFKILKHAPSNEIFIEALSNYSNIWRNINFIVEQIGLINVLECTKNPDATLEFLDRSLVDRKEFYEYIFNNEFELNVVENILIYFIKRENDKDILQRLKKRILEFDSESHIVEFINI